MLVISVMAWCLACGFLALNLSVAGGYSIPAAVLFLMSFLVFLKQRVGALKLTKKDYLLAVVFSGYALAMCFFVYLDGWHTRELDRPSRFLLCLPVLFMLLRLMPPKLPLLFYGVTAGAISSLGVALYDRFYLGLSRAQGSENAIMFGDTAMMLGFMSCAALMYFYHKKQWPWALISALAIFSGIAASFLSGSRGGWVAAPLIGGFLLWQSRDLFNKKLMLAGLLGASVFLVGVIATPQTGIQQRIGAALTDIKKYQSGDSYTSVGLRFDMWRSSFYLAAESPIFGEGQYGSREIRNELANQGLIHPQAAKFDHLHNEYLTALGFHGVVGLICLMLAYLVPLRLFMASVKRYRDNWDIKPYAIAGALVPMCYMDFALTQSMFSHNIGVMMYVFPIIFFWAALRWQEMRYVN